MFVELEVVIAREKMIEIIPSSKTFVIIYFTNLNCSKTAKCTKSNPYIYLYTYIHIRNLSKGVLIICR